MKAADAKNQPKRWSRPTPVFQTFSRNFTVFRSRKAAHTPCRFGQTNLIFKFSLKDEQQANGTHGKICAYLSLCQSPRTSVWAVPIQLLRVHNILRAYSAGTATILLHQARIILRAKWSLPNMHIVHCTIYGQTCNISLGLQWKLKGLSYPWVKNGHLKI